MASTARAVGSHVPAPSTRPATALSWRDAAIAILAKADRPLTAREIVERVRQAGLPVASASRTPDRSVNRDLHVAARRDDPQVVPVGPGRFVHRSACPDQVPPPQHARPRQPRGPRLPVEALQDAIATAGGIRAATAALGGRDQERLRQAYHRAMRRGWVDLYVVDEIAVRCLGVHPCMLYGAGWWDAVAVPAGRAV
jgi:hypothetical protein